MKEIEILGTVYQLLVDDGGMDQQNADGVCWCYGKKIQVRPPEKMLCQDDDLEAKNSRYREVLRHELIHACLFEAGLGDYCDDETLVDWLAKMFPRLAELFEEEGCLC